MKFKVGDKVRIIGKASDLKNFRDAEGEIIAVNEKYREYLTSLNDDVWFEENELELIKSNQGSQKSFQEIANEIGKFTDIKNDAYGSAFEITYEILEILLKKYKNNDGTYTVPESLLQHIPLITRILDKLARIFNNPDGDKMKESQYRDITGYGLIGVRMTENE